VLFLSTKKGGHKNRLTVVPSTPGQPGPKTGIQSA